MKFVCSVAYLVLTILEIYLGSKTQQFRMEELRGGRHKGLAASSIWVVTFITPFIRFWLLTRIFPLPLIVLLMVASLAANGIHSAIGAVVGFSLEEKKEKIAALPFIWGVQHKLRGCGAVVGATLLSMTAMIGSLWEFWTHPIGDPHAKVWIATLQFLLPQIGMIPFSISLLWPVVTSEFMDDDLRNSYLAASFSAILSQTLFLFFPVWVVRNEIPLVFGHTIPHLWMILTLPLIVFMLGGLLPFFIGIYRYRSQSRIMLKWQETWLQGLNELVQLPAGRARESALADKLQQLDGEVRRGFSRNPVLEFYTSLLMKDDTNPEKASALLTGGEPPVVSAQVSQLEISQTVIVPGLVNQDVNQGLNQDDKQIQGMLKGAREFLRGKTQPQPSSEDFTEQFKSIMLRYQSHLVEWDIRFGYLWNLLQLYDIGLESRTIDVRGFVQARLTNIKAVSEGLTSKKNVLAGGIMGTLSSAIVAVFKAYHTEIFEFIGRLARTS